MKSYETDTKYGEVKIVPTSGEHLHVNFDGFTVNRVAYHGGAHFYRWSDGVWRLGAELDKNGEPETSWNRRQSLHMTRSNWQSYRDMDPSQSAREKAVAELTEVVTSWTLAFPELLADAAADDHAKNVSMAEAAVRNAEETLDAAREELARVKAES